MALPTKVLTVALPFLMKQLPKLWPLLLEAKNREKVMELASSLAKASPTRRLGIKLELTETLAQSLVANADTEAEAARARAWQKRARPRPAGPGSRPLNCQRRPTRPAGRAGPGRPGSRCPLERPTSVRHAA